jgi:peptidoglycan/xylan/chitin deacetylase (PgdA/CDA1 family)
VRRTQAVLRDLVGEETTLFRPPHGKLTPLKLAGLWRAGFSIVLWNVDPKDFSRPSADALRDWFRNNPLRGGDVVLLHDDRPHATPALTELIEAARSSRLAFTTPPNWLQPDLAGQRS